jgi:hypothetical protein
VLVFLCAAAAFAGTFFLSGGAFSALKAPPAAAPHDLPAGGGAARARPSAAGLGRLGAGAPRRRGPRHGAETWVAPVLDFFRRYGLATALLLLALVGLYRISDIVLGVIANVFYQDLGFTKPEIAKAVNTFGVFVSIIGGFLGGILATRFGVMRILMLGAVLSAATNLAFVGLAYAGHNVPLMYADRVRRQPRRGARQRRLRRLLVEPDQRPVHRGAVRHLQLADDPAAEDPRRLLRQHRRQHRLSRVLHLHHADRRAGAAAGLARRAQARDS